MAEFLAIHQTDASLLGCLLRRLAGKVSLGASEAAAGVGFFQSGDVLLRKRPLVGQAAAPERLAEGVESEAALITAGALARAFAEETTLPFRFKRWLFSVAGQPEALAPARPALSKALPDYLRRAARGESAAESIFLTFLSRLRDAGKLDDVDVDAETAARSLAAAVGEAERACEQLGLRLAPLAAVATNGRVLAALRRGHPLWLGKLDGMTDCARCEISAATSELDPRVRAHRVLHALLVVSGAQSALPGVFREVGEGEVLAVQRGLEVKKL